MSVCPLCGQAKSATCCEQEKARHDAYRARQRDIEDLLNLFNITVERNPSREVAGEWAIEPHLPSLLAFLAELPCPLVPVQRPRDR